MEDKYQNKYRISSARLPGWNYAWNASYFVTICTKDRQNFFGDIADSEMILSQIGVIADIMWYEIKNHAKNIELGDFIVMPNHVHGIITLNEQIPEQKSDTQIINVPPVETRHALSLRKTPAQQRFQNQGKNTLSSIIGGYKASVTKHASRLKLNFAWQPRFHDHIIRNEESFQTISNYIVNNPQNWSQDKFFK
jgi:REP element-mobilizing transposase RayT